MMLVATIRALRICRPGSMNAAAPAPAQNATPAAIKRPPPDANNPSSPTANRTPRAVAGPTSHPGGPDFCPESAARMDSADPAGTIVREISRLVRL